MRMPEVTRYNSDLGARETELKAAEPIEQRNKRLDKAAEICEAIAAGAAALAAIVAFLG